MQATSTTAPHHQKEIEAEAGDYPDSLWITSHVVNELHAGLAILREMDKQCRMGKLATFEVAELINHPTLGEVAPEDTDL